MQRSNSSYGNLNELEKPLNTRTASFVEESNKAKFFLDIQAIPSRLPGVVTSNTVGSDKIKLVKVNISGCPGRQMNATDSNEPIIVIAQGNPFYDQVAIIRKTMTGNSPTNVDSSYGPVEQRFEDNGSSNAFAMEDV